MTVDRRTSHDPTRFPPARAGRGERMLGATQRGCRGRRGRHGRERRSDRSAGVRRGPVRARPQPRPRGLRSRRAHDRLHVRRDGTPADLDGADGGRLAGRGDLRRRAGRRSRLGAGWRESGLRAGLGRQRALRPVLRARARRGARQPHGDAGRAREPHRLLGRSSVPRVRVRLRPTRPLRALAPGPHDRPDAAPHQGLDRHSGRRLVARQPPPRAGAHERLRGRGRRPARRRLGQHARADAAHRVQELHAGRLLARRPAAAADLRREGRCAASRHRGAGARLPAVGRHRPVADRGGGLVGGRGPRLLPERRRPCRDVPEPARRVAPPPHRSGARCDGVRRVVG